MKIPNLQTNEEKKRKRRLPWLIAAVLVLILLLLIGSSWWRSSSAGPQVQVPMFYDAHYLFPRPWTQEQTAPGVPEPALLAFYGHNRVSQTFVSGSDQLAMVEVWLAGQENELVSISIEDDHDRSVGGELSLSAGSEGGVYLLSFEPIQGAKGRHFTISLFAPNSTIEKPVVTRTVGGDRLGGSINLNEYNRPGNLDLKTYSRGLPGSWWLGAVGEQILPSLFRLRLQQYKPSFFKGIFFPLLLFITAGLSILYLVLARPQAAPSLDQLSKALGWTVVLVLTLFLVWQVTTGRIKFRPIVKSTLLVSSTNAVGKAPAPGSEARLIYDLTADLWTAVRHPEERFVSSEFVDGMPAIRVPADSQIKFDTVLPPNARFRAGILGTGQGDLIAEVSVGDDSVQVTAVMAVSEPGANDITWIEIDLSPWSGQPVSLNLATESKSGESAGMWIMPQIETGSDWLFSDPLPADVEFTEADYTFADAVNLMGYNIMPATLTPGETAKIILYWRPLQETSAYAKLFIHLLDDQGNLVAQRDSQPVNNSYPIPVWQPGTTIRDEHELELPAGLPSGEYELAVGLYDPDSLERWPVTGADGMAIQEKRVFLDTTFEVSP